MIPKAHIAEWRMKTPWAEDAQVEQDLVISKALVEIFGDDFLRSALAFRGGTALHKLYFDPPERYSEDIDLVQIDGGPIGPVLDRLRAILQPWLGKANYNGKDQTSTLKFRFPAEGLPVQNLRLKVEINSREHFAVDGFQSVPFQVSSRWFSGEAHLTTYSLEELLATKLRALYERRKGRDAFDLDLGLQHPAKPSASRIVELFQVYMERGDKLVTRAQFEENLAEKRRNALFLDDIQAYIAASAPRYDTVQGLDRVGSELVALLPGDPWAGASG